MLLFKQMRPFACMCGNCFYIFTSI